MLQRRKNNKDLPAREVKISDLNRHAHNLLGDIVEEEELELPNLSDVGSPQLEALKQSHARVK